MKILLIFLQEAKMENNSLQFIKYPRIPHLAEDFTILNNPVEVYEKLDGGNSQVRLHKGVILAGNRSKFLTDKDTRFSWFSDFLKWAKRNYDFYNLPENWIVFGEWLAPHTLEYPLENQDKFYLIDLFDISLNKFIKYSVAKNSLEERGITDIEFLSPLHTGKIGFNKLKSLIYPSKYKEGNSEGVVIKDYESQKFAKLWASSLEIDQLNYDNLMRVYLSLVNLKDSKVSESDIVNEFHNDLKKTGFSVSLDKITKFVKHNYSSLNRDFSKI